MAVKGTASQFTEFVKKVGLFEAKVVAINPSLEELTDLGVQVKEDSKMADYLGEKDEDGTLTTTLRVSVWLEEVVTKDLFNVSFFLEDKIRYNKDSTKFQMINSVGRTCWIDDEANIPEWMTKKGETVRKAHVGEEELYVFGRAWLNSILRDPSAEIDFEWKKLMRGNVNEMTGLLKTELVKTIVALATIKTVEKEGEIKEYQGVYNRDFLPGYTMKSLRIGKYDPIKIAALKERKKVVKPDGRKTYLKDYEEFIINITDSEYGVKDFFVTQPLKDYDPTENIVSSEEKIIEDETAAY